jgi:heme/copper-type cytochrome/quinol oxidase subunit 2
VATGSPVTFMTLQTAVVGGGTPQEAASYTTAADGVVEIPLVIENTRFVPQVVQIPADTPVRLVVDRREDVACSDQIYLPQLNILVDLAPNGVTNVDIPATAKGTYTLTCGMSMMAGQLVVGDAGAGAGLLGRPVLWIVLAIAGAIGSLVIAQRRDARVASADKKGKVEAVQGLFGFSWLELAIIVATVAAAIIAGMSLGGSFN